MSASLLATGAAASADELIGRARTLLPGIAGRVAEVDRLRDTPDATVAELLESDLLRLFQPAGRGGYEADPRIFFTIQNMIAEACLSTAWVYGVLSVQSLVIALFDERAQADVWSKDGRATATSSFAPVGKAERVADGFRLDGRWTFASGSTHAQWALLGAKIAMTPGGQPEPRLFLVPRADYEIVDVWHTFGLRGTGSNDIIVRNAFVPEHRMFQLDPGVQNLTGAGQPASPLYRLPWLYLFTGAISNLAIGGARGALRHYLENSRGRVALFSGNAAKENLEVQQAAARLHAEIDTVEAMFDRHLTLLQRHVAADTPIPMQDGLLLRTQLTSSLRRLTAHVDQLMLLQGARAIQLASPVTRAWLDLCAARTHIGNDPAGATTLLGQSLIAGN